MTVVRMLQGKAITVVLTPTGQMMRSAVWLKLFDCYASRGLWRPQAHACLSLARR